MPEQIPSGGSYFVVELETKIEEVLSLHRDIIRDGRFRGCGPNLQLTRIQNDSNHTQACTGAEQKNEARSALQGKCRKRVIVTHLEYRLHLIQLRPRMLAGEHLDDETAYTPNVCLLRVCSLFDDLWGHPEDRTLQRRSMEAVAGHEVYKHRNIICTLAAHRSKKIYFGEKY